MDPGYWWQPMFSYAWIFPVLCVIFMLAMAFLMFGAGASMIAAGRRRVRRRTSARRPATRAPSRSRE